MSRFFNRLKDALDFNSSDMSGCCDVIVVEDEYGARHSTPFHLRIGTFQLLHHKLAQVQVIINGQMAKEPMLVNSQGVGYFQAPFDHQSEMRTSRLPSPFRDPLRANQAKLTIFGNDIEESRSRSMLPMQRSHNPKAREATREKQLPTKNPFVSTDNQQTALLFTKIKRFLAQNDRVRISLCAHLVLPIYPESQIRRIFEENMVEIRKQDAELEQLLNDDRVMLSIDGRLYDYDSGVNKLVQITLEPAQLDWEQKTEILHETSRKGSPLFSNQTKESRKPPQGFFKGLNLNVGVNQIEYRFKGNFGSETVIKCRLFYYDHQAQYRLLISDIDGTITKSDILGMVQSFLLTGLTQALRSFSQNWQGAGTESSTLQLATRDSTKPLFCISNQLLRTITSFQKGRCLCTLQA